MPRINNLRVPPDPSSDARLDKILADLSAEDRARLARTAADRAPRRPRRGEQIQYLTEEELARLFGAVRAAGSTRDLAIFELAYHRGLRASEVGMIDMSHVLRDGKRLQVTRAKRGHSGEYLLTQREQRALRAWLRERGNAPGAVFRSRNGSPICRSRLDQIMKSYGAAAQLPDGKRHFHCLRHSCATSLLNHDVGIEDVQDHLGHRHIANTQIYARITSRRRDRTGERLLREW